MMEDFLFFLATTTTKSNSAFFWLRVCRHQYKKKYSSGVCRCQIPFEVKGASVRSSVFELLPVKVLRPNFFEYFVVIWLRAGRCSDTKVDFFVTCAKEYQTQQKKYQSILRLRRGDIADIMLQCGSLFLYILINKTCETDVLLLRLLLHKLGSNRHSSWVWCFGKYFLQN